MNKEEKVTKTDYEGLDETAADIIGVEGEEIPKKELEVGTDVTESEV